MVIEQIQDWLLTLGTLLIGVSATFGAWVAWKGWKQQLRGQNEYELAVKLLAITYQMRDDLNALRNPLMSGSEMTKEDEQPLSLSPDKEQMHKALIRGYQARWDVVNKTREDLYTILVNAEAIWGDEVKKLFIEYSNHAMDIFHALQDHLEAINPSSYERSKEQTDFFIRGKKENPFDQKQAKIIKDIEAFLKPKLKS